MRTTLFYLLLMLFAFQGISQKEIKGKWKIDETGTIVNIYEDWGLTCGKVVELNIAPVGDTDPVCTKCEGDWAGKKIIGMDIIFDLKERDGEYVDGTYTDTETVEEYDCSVKSSKKKTELIISNKSGTRRLSMTKLN